MSVSQNYPTISPSLDLSFALTKKLDPRITFSRPTVGSYYDGKSVAKAEDNLVLYSEQFDNAAWLKGDITVSANSIAAPNGTITADTLTATTSVNGVIRQLVTQVSGDYTFSVWLKRLTGTGDIRINAGGVYVTVAVTTDWARYTVTQSRAAGTATAGLFITTSGDAVYAWGAQLEQRSSVTAYTPTTTQPITNYIPTLLSAPANVARFDHNPVTGESLGLLVEELRTNLVLRSEEFDNAAWAKTGATVTANTVVAPDGTLTADKIVENAANALHSIGSQNQSITSGQSYAFSFYAKAGERSFVQIAPSSTAFGASSYANFNLSTGTVSASAVGTASIQNVGNGWYRCMFVVTATTTAVTGALNIALQNSPTAARLGSYTGDGYSGIYIWGAQLEASTKATSYIKTEASQVTRSADSGSDSTIDDWYRADQGTLYIERSDSLITPNSRLAVLLKSGTPDTRVADLYFADNNTLAIYTEYNNVAQVNTTLATGLAGKNIKVALAIAKNDFAWSVNGGSVGSDTSVLVAEANQLFIGSTGTSTVQLNGHIKKISYYPARLTDEQLQALTS